MYKYIENGDIWNHRTLETYNNKFMLSKNNKQNLNPECACNIYLLSTIILYETKLFVSYMCVN
jgi:hypothetical protein